jgi:hypothetical protein
MKIIIPFIAIILFAISGCYYDSQEYLYPNITPCDTTNVTYSLSVQPIIYDCLGCHSNSTAASLGGNVKLQSYADVKLRVDDGKLLSSIKWTSSYHMPKNAAKLDDCKITIVQKWVDAGAPNN